MRGRLHVRLLFLVAVVITAVWAGYAQFTRAIEDNHEREMLAAADNAIRGFEQSTAHIMRSIDNSLRSFAREYGERGLREASEFAESGLFDRDVIHHLSLIDADGTTRYVSARPDARLNVADRPFFRVHAESRDDALFIDVPAPGDVVARPLIRMSRRLGAPDGRFAGVVVAAVDPHAFVSLYRTANFGPHGSVSLIGLDKVIRARGSPDGDAALGRALPRAQVWEELARAPAGRFWQPLQTDGIERAYSYRRLEGYPLVVTIGVARKDIQAAVTGLQRNVLVLAVLLTATTIAVAVFILAQRRAAERLHGALRLNRDFLARVSHELRTPLNAIIGFSEVIKGRMLGPDALDRYAEYAEDIHASGQQLLMLVNDVLDLSSLQAGKVALACEPVDLTAAVEWAIRVIGPQAELKDQQIDMAVHPGVSRVTADPRAVRQMLVNLLSNAVKFTPEGGRIVVAALRGRGGRCILRVSDTGIGMTAEQMSQAMVPFGQVSALTARVGQGHGLGLAIVKALIEAHGGRLSIDSRPGEGSRVELEFAS
ncbi:MAG TPA: ATP-binding protein [Azospirillum sp.]|nr:ATP-binding protein [Azospirillum sp.]